MTNKNYSADTHRTKELFFTPELLKQLEQIKRKYELKDVDFNKWLKDLFSWSEIWKEEYKINSSKADKFKSAKIISHLTTKLIDKLNKSETILQHTTILQRKLNEIYRLDITSLKSKLEILNDIILLIQDENKDYSGGRPKNSYQRRCVSYLIDLYKKETDKKPECYWNEIEGSYKGETYYFLLDMQSVLQDLGLPFNIKPETIGLYARDELEQVAV